MDLFVLDDKLRRKHLIDSYESLIWAERFQEAGDFKLKLRANHPRLQYIQEGSILAIKESYKVMFVEEILDTTEANGNRFVEITGWSGEYLLDKRVVKEKYIELNSDPHWEITGPPNEVLRDIVYHICVDGALSADDKIPYLIKGELLGVVGTWVSLPATLKWDAAVGTWATGYVSSPGSTEPLPPATFYVKYGQLYDAVVEIAKAHDIGFRLLRNFDHSELYFEAYRGEDRTSRQLTHPPIRFSMSMDNLLSSKHLRTRKDSVNVAYVYSKKATRVIAQADVPAERLKGFDRSVRWVEVTDYEDDQSTADHLKQLLTRGTEEINKHQPLEAFEGEILSRTHRYGEDYNLGDLVEVQNQNGVVSIMRVTEQVFVNDLEGYRAYPTLSRVQTIDTKTWAGQRDGLYWSIATGYWADWI